MSEQAPQGAIPGQRTKLLVLFVLFLAPVVGAWLLYANLDRWQPSSTVNRGDLVVPARPIEPFKLRTLDGGEIDEQFLQHKWTLVYIGPSDCADACRRALYDMRQVRLALGREIDRVQRLMVLGDAERLDGLKQVLPEFPGMPVTVQTGSGLDALVAQFALREGDDPRVADRIYIVDPLGNLMMSYAPGADARGMLKDLERLLKVSHIG